uniref:Uncharacterized protein n=1 Tax=Plectus sambesii TaxID=2011161 RepID=A0A914VFH9_9BILA
MLRAKDPMRMLKISQLASSWASGVCEPEQEMAQPCRCCKMRCWYDVAQAAKMELGHVPGEAGEQEVLATLKVIRACMISECTY